MTKELILPSEIPWVSLYGKDLEECLYWLIDAMGAKDLEWRLGGKGEGAPDQGRDLEAHFYIRRPDKELIRQKWWIEAKGCIRTRTVRKTKVQEAILNAAGTQELDVFVIATNSQFSNATLDWVKDWQKSNPRPEVLLWDRYKLEKYLSNHPEVVVRLFSDALSLQGKLELVRSRFWNYVTYCDKPTLKLLWKERNYLEWNSQSRFAVLVSEVANGRVDYRPWAAIMKPEDLMKIFILGLLNTFYFITRAERAGVSHIPYLRGVSYLLLAAINVIPLERLKSILIEEAWINSEGTELIPKEHRNYIIQPVLGQLATEINDVCHIDCQRESCDPIELTEEEIKSYWDRLKEPIEESDEDKEEKYSMTIAKTTIPCSIGFEILKNHSCPISDIIKEKNDIAKALELIRHVIMARAKKRNEPNSLDCQ